MSFPEARRIWRVIRGRRIRADGLYGNRIGGELDAVVLHGKAHEASKEIVQSLRAKVDRPEKVDVARGPCVRAEPMAKQERALENELIAVW